MAQSIQTRREIITAMNQRGRTRDIYVAKLEDEFRLQPIGGGGNPAANLPDDDLVIPVVPGLYLVEQITIFRTTGSISSTNGIQWNWTGPLGITDGFMGSFAQLFSTPQKNTPLTGFATPQSGAVGAALINTNICVNQSGYVRFREPGDLVFNWTSIIAGGAGVTLLTGSSIHLVRALNDGD